MVAAEVWAASEAAASEAAASGVAAPGAATADVNPKGHEADVAAQSLLLLLSQQDEPVQSTEPLAGLALEEVLVANSDMVVLCCSRLLVFTFTFKLHHTNA